MQRYRLGLSAAATALLAVGATVPSADGVAGKTPVITGRTYVGGVAHVKVKGSFQIDEDVALNKAASYSDGEMTWLQYGVSGSESPNALITVSSQEIGVSASRGKHVATTDSTSCKGSMEVGATSITGHYTCPGVTSFSQAAGLGTVTIEIRFTATS